MEKTINEYDDVRIIESGIPGQVIDIAEIKGVLYYTVESFDRLEDGLYGLFTCERHEIEHYKLEE